MWRSVLKALGQQAIGRMERNNKMTMTSQMARRQSQKIQNESHTKMGAEYRDSSSIPSYRKRQKEKVTLRDHSDNSYCHAFNTQGPVSFNKQQDSVLQAIAQGQSVFVTGSAGTGKSFLLGYVVKILRKMHGSNSVFVTASTGIAAWQLGGMTLHSFAGAKLGFTTKYEMLKSVQKDKDSVKRWIEAKALVIDEISMVDGEFFDRLNYVANELRRGRVGGNSKRAWGGLQLVVTGDFFQLPPVNPQNPDKYFAFEADCWDECFHKQIELSHVFRQSERGWVDMLEEIRIGLQNPITLEKLDKCHSLPVTENGSVVRLYPRNDDVRRHNEEKLKALGQAIFTFTARDRGEQNAMDQLKSGIAHDQIGLCLGAQVMLIKNIDIENKLVNGATGVIVDFVKDKNHSEKDILNRVSHTGVWPKVKFHCGKKRTIRQEVWTIMEGEVELARRTQVPLILAWALSVHKCQGMTLERVETDLRRAFGYGMVYVTLSRVKNLDGLRLIGFNPSMIKAHPKVLDFYQKLNKQKEDTLVIKKNN